MMTLQGQVLELLLSGVFICQTSNEEAWRYLKVEANAQGINEQLQLLNRCLSQAADEEVFYASYQNLGENERKVLGQQFSEIANNLLPLVEWLLLVQQANGSDIPVSQGSALRLTELQAVIEDTPAFAEQLLRISRMRLFNSQSKEIEAQLKQVFKRLTDLGYVMRPNPDKQIYIATGKIDYLYDVLKFIDETEALSLQEQAEQAVQQGSLL